MVGKKKIALLITALLGTMSFVGCGGNNVTSEDGQSLKKIGIVQLVQHPALDVANEGFIEGLKEKGFEDGKNIEIDQKNAQNKIDMAKQIAGQFVSDKKELIFAIATPVAQACLNETKDIPIVFTAVTDPITDGLAKTLDSSGANTTGTSDKVNIEEQIQLFKKLVPDAKNLGVIYTTSETNSVNQVKELKDLAPKYGLTIEEIGITNVNEINQNLTHKVKDIDALYAPTDNTVASAYDLVGKICVDNNVPILAAEPAAVNKGALVSNGIDYKELGKMAGYKAAEILNGTNPSDIKIETMKELAITINTDVASKLNITIPEDIEKDSTKVTGGVN